jgi:multidrug efflux pump subunit AcrB
MGVALIPLLPIKHLPSNTLPAITVGFSMPNNSSRVVEMTATSRLEAMLARIKGVRRITSTSRNGGGSITLEFDKHTSMDIARFEASTIVRQTWNDLPREVSYPTISVRRPDENAARPFMQFTINAAVTPILIQQYAENNIKPRLSEIAELYRIDVRGATPMEWQLVYDADQLIKLGVSVGDISEAISAFYTTDFLGIAETRGNSDAPSFMRIMLTSGSSTPLTNRSSTSLGSVAERSRSTFDASAITVRNRDGALIRLDQLVTVKHTEQQPQSHTRINGLNSITISLTAEETANQIRLSQQVNEAMNEIRRLLPLGYEIHKSYDATEYIHAELNKIYLRCGLTVLILLLFVLLITRNVRYLFLIMVTLVINLAIAVIFYYFFGLEIQLYSLASITISLSLIIDNTIIMTDHIIHRGNRNAIMPILAATLTSIGALSIIFFLDEAIRLNLQDFAAVIIINLSVSLLVAMLFVPAMVEKIGLAKTRKHESTKARKASSRKKSVLLSLRAFVPSRLRIAVYLNRFYSKLIRLMMWRRWIPFTVIVLTFGLPVTMIPDKIEIKDEVNERSRTMVSERSRTIAEHYNKIFDNADFKEKVRPIINKTLGGTLRLFTEKVFQGSYFDRGDGELVLSIRASMPNGTTLPQMNALIEQMERYLTTFPEIRQFQTNIPNPRQATIQVFFTKEAERTGFPYQLENRAISKSLELGGGSWGVGGLPGTQGFNNDVREHAGSYRVRLYGYNYDELMVWSETLRDSLLSNRRINEVIIGSEFSWFKDDYREFMFDFHKERLAVEGLLPSDLYFSLRPIFERDRWVSSIMVENERENIMLSSRQSQDYDIWALRNVGHVIGNRLYKVDELADIVIGQMPQQIFKENQQYRLVLQYDYVGAHTQGQRHLERLVKELNEVLPMGYTAEIDGNRWFWGQQNKKQYWLIGLLLIIIFFTTSILFNSIKQPFAVIFVIPVSFIGVFLTFYLFKLRFDTGGFASFILLSALTVNASIYILNEYNRLRKFRPLLSPLQAYIKAWNVKIIPIFLTVVSTMLGFLPFIVGTSKEGFWFPLATGTIGGLLMSVIGIYLFLPLMTLKKKGMKI